MTTKDLRQNIVDAALNWWHTKRPLCYTGKEHMADPTINCVTTAEAVLAENIGNYLNRKRGTRKR